MLVSEKAHMQSSSLLLRPVPSVNLLTTPMGILNDHSDVKMPESPVDQALTKSMSMSQPSSLVGPNLSAHPRSHSTSSSTGSIVNGLHSPRSMNGTPSPPTGLGGVAVSAIQGVPANQEVPAACGARQLSKLKRFLTTLQQFGSDISPEIGERVRGLVMGLVNNALTVEEFHNKLQEATNFPLRPFVIPFLKANLPLLQRELMHCARLAKLSPQQYYLQHEHQLLEPKTNSVDPTEHLMEVNENGKRKTPEERMIARPKENGSNGGERLGEGPHPKRHCNVGGSPTHPTSAYPPLNHFPHSLSAAHHAFRVEDLGTGQGAGIARDSRDLREMREMREMRERLERERERDRHTPHAFPPFREVYPDPMLFEDRVEDDWKHVETMLQCIIGMVEKTKRALAVLHQRSIQDREELAHWNRRQSSQSGGNESGGKKRTDEMMAQTLRQTEDRVTEVKRRAEEAVNEVKRQAVSELQKAVTAAERKANEMVSAERTKLDRAIVEARQQASDEALGLLNHQEDSSESCWNCGRKANETCSGCNTARYCGAFCQHKDWENHHRMCSQYANNSATGGQLLPGFPLSSTAPPSMPPSTISVASPSPAALRSLTPVVVSTAAAAAATAAVPPSSAPTPTSAASPTGSHHSNASNRSGSPATASSAAAIPQES
ncbi:protein CBFA2T1 isoform X2 [Strongylocentrotus purpuratus]|uniref:Protein CBFA2T3 n=1 Tax=Strongylocentrotus purpuratus TaxID=7668 RepID=A0A7M7N4H7_STRPU|nr:protein CBFA2T1 isoform X2 [Strongylocentrotus purpuratus]